MRVVGNFIRLPVGSLQAWLYSQSVARARVRILKLYARVYSVCCEVIEVINFSTNMRITIFQRSPCLKLYVRVYNVYYVSHCSFNKICVILFFQQGLYLKTVCIQVRLSKSPKVKIHDIIQGLPHTKIRQVSES